jgi:P-type E1-E2 ATPase
MSNNPMDTGVYLDIPGSEPVTIKHLVLDFTGTLSYDGILLPGVAERLEKLAQNLRITVLTADTFGTAAGQLEPLPVNLYLIQTGQDKALFMADLKKSETAAIGNGRNDVEMIGKAGLGIAVIGPEGCAGELIVAAGIVCRTISDALDLFLNPLRIKATLRD